MTHILSVINQKGGTAKTTTAVTLGAQFARVGKRVLLVDLDPQANATIAFGVDAARVEKSTYDILVRGAGFSEVAVASGLDRLDLAPGHVDLSKTDINLADRDGKQLVLKNALAEVAGRYDYILIDCAPSLGLLPVNALTASTGVIIPLVPNYFALEGLKQVQESIRKIRAELNPNLEITGILFCMVDARLKITLPAMEMVRNFYGKQAFQTVIRICNKLNESQIMGKPIFDYAPRARAAVEYAALAEEIAGRVGASQGIDKRIADTFKSIFTLN